MFDRNYDRVMDEIHNKMFIVNAPAILKYSEYERKEFPVCTSVIDGAEVDTSMDLEVYGMTLYNIAKHAMDGFGISLYKKEDFDTIYRLLKKYKEYAVGASEYEVNTSTRSVEEKELMFAFAEEVFELNKNSLPNIMFQFKKMSKDINMVIPDTKSNKPINITKRATKVSW